MVFIKQSKAPCSVSSNLHWHEKHVLQCVHIKVQVTNQPGFATVYAINSHAAYQASIEMTLTLYARSPLIRLANWMSFGMMVTRLAWMAHKFVSAKQHFNLSACTQHISCSCKAMIHLAARIHQISVICKATCNLIVLLQHNSYNQQISRRLDCINTAPQLYLQSSISFLTPCFSWKHEHSTLSACQLANTATPSNSDTR